MIRVDTSAVDRFSAELGRVPGRAVPAARAVVQQAVARVKDDARARVSTHPSWKRLAASINYDLHGLSAEVGYDDQGQGELAGIYEYGSAHHAPHPTLLPAAQAEEEKFAQALSRAMTGLL